MTNPINNNSSQPVYSGEYSQEIWNYLFGPEGILQNVQASQAQGAEGDANSVPAEYSQILGEEFFDLYNQVSKAAAQGEIPPPGGYLHSKEEIQTFSGNKSGLDYDLNAILQEGRVMSIVESLGEYPELGKLMNSNIPNKGTILAFAVLYLGNKEKVEKLFKIAADLDPNSSQIDQTLVMAKLTQGTRNMSKDLTAGTNAVKSENDARSRIAANMVR